MNADPRIESDNIPAAIVAFLSAIPADKLRADAKEVDDGEDCPAGYEGAGPLASLLFADYWRDQGAPEWTDEEEDDVRDSLFCMLLVRLDAAE